MYYESLETQFFSDIGPDKPLKGLREYERHVRHLLVDSAFRDVNTFPSPGEYTFTIGSEGTADRIKNVISINLIRAELPNITDSASREPRYVDIVIDDIPKIGSKVSNSIYADRVIGRISFTAGLREQRYFPHTTEILREEFSPISFDHFSIKLIDDEGNMFDSDDDHTLLFEIVSLKKSKHKRTSPPTQTQPIPHTTLSLPTTTPPDTAQSFMYTHKWTIISVGIGALSTWWLVAKLKGLISNASSNYDHAEGLKRY